MTEARRCENAESAAPSVELNSGVAANAQGLSPRPPRPRSQASSRHGSPESEPRDRCSSLIRATRLGESPETRCISFLTDDTPEQTRRIFHALADLEDGADTLVDFEAWHQLQRWIAAHGENRVVIPYIKTLAELMPTSATRLRRDFISMLCLVRAHAILHQQTRRRDDAGRIIATVARQFVSPEGGARVRGP